MKDKDDLDTLVTELNAGAPRAPRSDEQTARLRSWLEQVVERSASDLLLVAGAPPSVRIDGVVLRLGSAFGGPLGSEEIEEAVAPALPPYARRLYREAGIADGSFRTPDLGRFRINLHHERGRAAAAIRRLPSVVPRFAALNLPPPLEALTRLPRGLVLVGGPTGSGNDDPGGPRERGQPSRGAAHHHHRRSDRVRASTPEVGDRAD
jgi:twitching motility protein PilT